MSRRTIHPRSRSDKAARRRAGNRRQMELFRLSRLLPLIKRMSLIKPEERDWRVAVLTCLDDRTLTGRICGDPIYFRSALYFKRMQAA